LSYLGFDSRSPRYLSMDSTQFLVVHPDWRGRSQILALLVMHGE